MTERVASRSVGLFAGMPYTAQQNFTLYFYAAVLRVARQAALHFGSAEAANERLPFLAGYMDEIARLGLEGATLDDAFMLWCGAIEGWEREAPERLPLVALRSACDETLTRNDLVVLAQIGLPAEDPRFGTVFDVLQGESGERNAMRGLLGAGWEGAEENGNGHPASGHTAVNRLLDLGLIEAVPGHDIALRPCAAAWDALRGVPSIGNAAGFGASYQPRDTLPRLDQLILGAPVRETCERLREALHAGVIDTVVLRGLSHNGRRTLAAALARDLGKGVVAVSPSSFDSPHDRRWKTAASVACLLDAAILTAADPAPSETFELPAFSCRLAPLLVVLGLAGGVGGTLTDSTATLQLPIPDRETRERLWQLALGGGGEGVSLPALRLTSGNIIRAGKLALAGRRVVPGSMPANRSALSAAVRSLERRALESLARRMKPLRDWSHLSLPADTHAELRLLAARCRQREELGLLAGEALRDVGPGIRALFKGPSGTGKTLAARMLAGELDEMDLYRLDLAAVVNKYIGETEKNLERAFTAAEELDVILLLDEGDALLTQRTGVHNANDRYANLETNYLLQRLESYEGILLVATNAGDRIDSAFQRRMDVVIDFPLPDATERWAIWQVHLPARHEVELQLLEAAVQRCTLSGGQIRNIALHASLIAAEDRAILGSRHLEVAIEREYRKLGAVSPMRARSRMSEAR